MFIDLHSHGFPLSAREWLPSGAVVVSKQAANSYRFAAGGNAFPPLPVLINLDTQVSDLRREKRGCPRLMA